MGLRESVFLRMMRERARLARAAAAERKPQLLLESLFPEQQGVILDPCRYKVILCPRRAGKSYCLAAYILYVCLTVPNANVMFIAQTRDRAKDILWEIIKKLNKRFGLGLRYSEVYLSGRLPNGSKFRLSGCETKADVEKYRGEAYHLVLLDECASHSAELIDTLLQRAIEPTLADHKGTLVLAGTPGHVLAGTFYKVSGDPAFEADEENKVTSRPYAEREMGRWVGVKFHWSFHAWSKKENRALEGLWEEAEARRLRNGWSEQHPIFVREDLGRWIADDSVLCYRFLVERNTWTPKAKGYLAVRSLPTRHQWQIVIGCDFGSGVTDKFACQAVAFSDTHPNIYHVYEYVADRKMSITEMAKTVVAAASGLEEMGFEVVDFIADLDHLADAIQKQFLEEFNIFLEKAEKKNKRDFIELVNSDLVEQRCFVMAESNLSRQMQILAWDETQIKEKSGQRNDAADAFLYTWRKCRHRFFEDPKDAPKPGTLEFETAREDEEVRHLVEYEERQKFPQAFDDNPGDQSEWRW